MNATLMLDSIRGKAKGERHSEKSGNRVPGAAKTSQRTEG